MGSNIIIWATTFLFVSFNLCLHPTCGNPPESSPAPGAAASHAPLHCYVCESDKDSKCTPLKPSADAIPSSNCEDPNKLLQKWLGGQAFTKMGVGSVNFKKVMGIAEEKAGEKVEKVSACIYMYVSDENMVTKGLDEGVSKVRGIIPGDKGAKDAVSVKKWIFRDCISVELDHENAKKNETLNRCKQVETEGTGQVHICVCRSDKCNEPQGSVMGYLKERCFRTEENGNGAEGVGMGGDKKLAIKVAISLALVVSLARI